MNKLCDCIMPHIEEKCGQEAVDFVEGLIKRAIGRTFDVSCREYEPNSAKCNGLLPGLHQKPFSKYSKWTISHLSSDYLMNSAKTNKHIVAAHRWTQYFSHKSGHIELRELALNVMQPTRMDE